MYFTLPFCQKACLILCTLCFPFAFLQAQVLTPSELLKKSIQYHDPNERWGKTKLELNLTEIRPTDSDRQTKVVIDPRKESFYMDRTSEGVRIEQELEAGNCLFRLNGNSELSPEEIEKYRLNCERAKIMRNYYTYIWGLPMKLQDEGTNLESVKETQFKNEDVYELKVTYDPSIGSDVWYFYFNKNNYALIGYRFYHDESKNDGEYITLEDEEEVKGIKIPKIRKWYVNIDDEYLGSDTLAKK